MGAGSGLVPVNDSLLGPFGFCCCFVVAGVVLLFLYMKTPKPPVLLGMEFFLTQRDSRIIYCDTKTT